MWRQRQLENGVVFGSRTYTSYWTLSSKKIPQVADLDRWEALSRENPLFVLDVPWLPAVSGKEKMTVQKLVDRIVAVAGGDNAPLDSSEALAQVLFHNGSAPAGNPV